MMLPKPVLRHKESFAITFEVMMQAVRQRVLLLAVGLELAGAPLAFPAVEGTGYGDAVFHPGATGYASLPDSQVQGLDYQKNLTVEAALFIEANAAGGRWPIVLGKMYSPPQSSAGFALGINQGQFKTVGQQIYATVADGSQKAAVSSRFFQGTVHAVMTWSASSKTLRLYMNGALEGSATNILLTASLQNTQDLKLAGPSNLGQSLQRDIFFARLWNRALGDHEVLSAWTNFNGLGQHTLPSGFDRNSLVSEWLLYEMQDATHLKDTAGANHLQLQGTASVWQGSGALALVSPTDGATAVSKSALLKVSGGTSTLGGSPVRPLQYWLEVDETNTFDSPALKSSGWLAGSGAWKPVLKPSTRYYWRAQARDSSPEPVISAYAATNSFTTKAAADWYARPGVYGSFNNDTGAPIPTPEVYGRQDGTSYENAWNGIVSIVWGEGGVEPGDTVYVCGVHCYTASNLNFLGYQAVNYITESGYSEERPITIRMDSPSEPGVMWGAYRNSINGGATWNGPDDNEVYWSTNLLYSADYYADGTNITILDRETAPTWPGHPGATFNTNGVWYVKPPDGSNPGGKICTSGLGYRFHLGRSSHIRFYQCRFRNAAPAFEMANLDPSEDTQTKLPRSCYIGFDGCELWYNAEVTPTQGNDHWTIRNCELAFSKYGVYTFLNRRSTGANYLTVQDNYIHDIGTARFPNGDAHGIGIQGGEGHIIQGNRIENTGAAIEFWTGSKPMKNHTVRYNFIKNIRIIPGGTGGGGVVISGDNVGAILGLRTGFKIYGNIIMNTGLGATEDWQGAGISSNCKDYVEICNNTIYNATKGIKVSVINDPAQVRIANNIVLSPRSAYLAVVGSGPSTNVFIDHNLFYPATNISAGFTVYPNTPHNQHSVFADALLLSAAPATADDFRLRQGSPAIDAGLDVGLIRDFLGTGIPQGLVPDIGAFEFISTLKSPQPPVGLRLMQQKLTAQVKR